MIRSAASPGILSSNPRGKWTVVAILVLALALRSAFVAESRDTYAPLTDASHFDHIATSIAEGKGYGNTVIEPAEGPSAFRAPLYPAVLGMVYAVFGDHNWTWGRLANAFIGTVLVALLGLVAAQLWSRRVGLITLSLAAVHPTLILYGTSLQLEPLLATLSLATLAAALQSRRTVGGWRWPLLTGILLGLAILTREIAVALALPVVWLLWTRGERSWRDRAQRGASALKFPAVALIVAVAVIAPWTVRNAIRFDEFVPVSSSTGFGFAGTYNETSNENAKDPAVWIPPYADPSMQRIMFADATKGSPPTETEVEADLREASVDFVRDHPAYPLKVVAWNTVRLFDLKGPGHALFAARFLPYPPGLTRLAVYSSWILGLVALVGLALGSARSVPRAVWAIPLLTFSGLVILCGNIRYRASLEAFTVLLAAAAVGTVLDRWQDHRTGAQREASTEQGSSTATT